MLKTPERKSKAAAMASGAINSGLNTLFTNSVTFTTPELVKA
jgi:hypothetical protein